ncbi:MGMT family protein [Brevibacterium renqingii]|uniref:MGMT family protein n=1 Tax=Brevibacterium renqingii TaxID=2776916 RepID=UPI001AE06B60|nr:MGMT family protein [Brevibacterium renqingii]
MKQHAEPDDERHLAVRDAVRSVPAGAVATYGDIGKMVGIGPRQAGRLVGMNADRAPWWRVVYADGSPATCHSGTAPSLLQAEGVGFDGTRVDMRAHRFANRVEDGTDDRVESDAHRQGRSATSAR